MAVREQDLIEKLDDINEEIRRLRDQLEDDDTEDREDDPDADNADGEGGSEGGDEPTDEEIAERLDDLLTEYEETEQRLKKLQKRNARVTNIQTRHAERSNINDRVGSAPIMPHNDRVNTRNGRHQYSLMRAIRGQTNAILGHGPGLSGLELEVHQELARTRGKAPAGVLIPWDAGVQGRQTRALSTTTGTGAVGVTTLPTMIDALRDRLVLVSLGANLITDQTGPFSLPKTTTAVTGSHVSTEGTPVSQSDPAIGDLDFTYKSIEASTKLTRQFINGASVSAEAYIVDQLTKAVATALENAALNGAGTGGAPKGLFKHTASPDGIGVKVMGANGDKPDWTDVVEMTGMVDTANAPNATRAFLTNPTMVAYFQSTPKESGYPVYILGDSGTINGYPVASTSLVPNNLTKGSSTSKCSAIAFGSWEEMLIALFTGLDLFIDPFSSQPHVNVTVAQDYDVHLAHAESFAICIDALSA